MKCPKCNTELVVQTRHGMQVYSCTNDHGMWFDAQEFDQLENQGFNNEHDKGTLVFSSTPSNYQCPKCSSPLRQFDYRLYDLTLEYCENKDGFWLDAGEDDKVIQLMRNRKKQMFAKPDEEAEWKDAEQHEDDPEVEWKMDLLRLRSKEFIDRLVESIRR